MFALTNWTRKNYFWNIWAQKVFFQTDKVTTNKSGFEKFARKYRVWIVFVDHGKNGHNWLRSFVFFLDKFHPEWFQIGNFALNLIFHSCKLVAKNCTFLRSDFLKLCTRDPLLRNFSRKFSPLSFTKLPYFRFDGLFPV